MSRASLSLVTVLTGLSLAQTVFAQSEDDKLGKVHFETSCNAEAQKLFDRGAGDPEAAKPDIARLGELRDKLREAKDAYWSEQVDIQARIASAWVLYAEGKKDEALKAMSDAADAEDRTEKHPVTPGTPKPARELYGEMLLDNGRAAEALTAFEATLKKEPNRLGAYAGAARAAAQIGDTAKAREYFGKIVEQAGSGDSTRTEVADARNYLAGR